MINNTLNYLGIEAPIHFDAQRMLLVGQINDGHEEFEFTAHDIVSLKNTYEKQVSQFKDNKSIMSLLHDQLTNITHTVQTGDARIHIDPNWSVTRLGLMVLLLLKFADGAPFTLREKTDLYNEKNNEGQHEKY